MISVGAEILTKTFNNIMEKAGVFRGGSIPQGFRPPKSEAFAQKTPIRHVEMSKLTKYVRFWKIIFGMKHPTYRVFHFGQISKIKDLEIFRNFKIFLTSYLVSSAVSIEISNRNPIFKVLAVKFSCVLSIDTNLGVLFWPSYDKYGEPTQWSTVFSSSAPWGTA